MPTPKDNTERRNRIEAIYAHANSEHRPVNKGELDEIEKLSAEIYDEAQAWLRSKQPASA
jgi:hypothetical protein